jgi:hypothetical protein
MFLSAKYNIILLRSLKGICPWHSSSSWQETIFDSHRAPSDSVVILLAFLPIF